MTSEDIKILDDLLSRTENLPEILHLRAADVGYQLTDNDKSFLGKGLCRKLLPATADLSLTWC